MNILNTPVTGDFPPRLLDSPKIFVLEVGKDGFNAYAYALGSAGDSAASVMEIFAASRSTLDFLRVMETIYSSNGNNAVEFAVVDPQGPKT